MAAWREIDNREPSLVTGQATARYCVNIDTMVLTTMVVQDLERSTQALVDVRQWVSGVDA